MNDLRTRRAGALADTFAPSLYRFAVRLVGQDADAEDVVQQTFASVMAHADAFEGDDRSFRSWVFTIAYRTAMDVLRGRRRAVPLDEDVPAEAAEPVDLETPPAEIRRAFALISPDDQQILTLKYQDDFSNVEIAGILGITATHVGVLLYRAKQNLRKAIR